MAEKLTPWFSSDVKPRRMGIYEVRAGDHKSKVKWAVWKNGQWYLALPSIERALRAYCFSNDMLYDDARWRGLASNPEMANHD